MRLFLLVCCAAVLVSCGDGASYSDFNTRNVTLPNGQVIQAESASNVLQRARGLMFRTSLDPDRGMLFIHEKPGLYSYFMYQHEIPLDMIWIDTGHVIVDIVENAPPCHTQASQCPHYGGNTVANFVLELAAGMVRKYELKVGQRIEF